jgi:hypothetical protein
MQNSIERRRLHRKLYDEPVCAWFVLAKCAAGLAIVTLLAAIAVSEERGASSTLAHRPIQKAATGTPENAEAHRRQLFAQRRLRFNGGDGRRSVVSETTDARSWSSTVAD